MPDSSDAKFFEMFDPEKVKFTKDLQRSQYVLIEENMVKINDLEKFESCKDEDDDCPVHGGPNSQKQKKEMSNFSISFQHMREVQKKKEMFYVWQK